MYRGEKYVACERDCEPSLLGFAPTLYAKGDEFDARHWEPSEEGGVAPPEGGAAPEKDRSVTEGSTQGEPPPGFLEVMWEGYDAETSEAD